MAGGSSMGNSKLNQIKTRKLIKNKELLPIIIFHFFASLTVFCQGEMEDINIEGKLTNTEKKVLAFHSVYIIENSDTICSMRTNEQGFFQSIFCLDLQKNYFLKFDKIYFPYTKDVVIYQSGDSNRIDFYKLELSLLEALVCNFDSFAYFDFNEIENFETFDIYGWKRKFIEIPGLYMTFYQRSNPLEEPRILTKILLAFEKYLIGNGISQSHFEISNEIIKLDNTSDKDLRSRIEGKAQIKE